jgi:hypothetical protein
MIIHNRAGVDMKLQTRSNFAECDRDDFPRLVVKEEGATLQMGHGGRPEPPKHLAGRLRALTPILDASELRQLLVVNMLGVRSPRVIGEPRPVRRPNRVIPQNHRSVPYRKTVDVPSTAKQKTVRAAPEIAVVPKDVFEEGRRTVDR